MTKKKTFLKRTREKLITQDFFALPENHDGPASDHTADCACRPFQVADTKPGDWIRTDLINKTSTAKYQEEIKQAYLEQSRLQRQKDESPAMLEEYIDWRDQTNDFVAATTKIAQQSNSLTTRIDAQCCHAVARAAHLGEELDAMLCFVQAFNADKPLHVAYEQHFEIRREQVARHGRTLPDRPSFLAKMDAESAKLEITAQRGGTNREEKWKPPRRKKGTTEVVLAEFEQNWRAAVAVVREVCRGIAVNTAALPSDPPEDLTFYSHKLPGGLPQYIRQEIHDGEFILHEVYISRKHITSLRDKARTMLMVWMACDNTTWEYATKYAHESPHMVLYEHTRLDLAACYIIWRRGEDKIRRYVIQNNLMGDFSDALRKALGLTMPDEACCVHQWASMLKVIKEEADSVADMLQECKDARRKFGEAKKSESMHEQDVRPT